MCNLFFTVVTISYFFCSISVFFINFVGTISEFINDCDFTNEVSISVTLLIYDSSKTPLPWPSETDLLLLSLSIKIVLFCNSSRYLFSVIDSCFSDVSLKLECSFIL